MKLSVRAYSVWAVIKRFIYILSCELAGTEGQIRKALKMFALRTCFGCCNLRAGCIWIGSIELFALFLTVMLHGLSQYVFYDVMLVAVLIYGIFDRNCLFLWTAVFANIAKMVIVGAAAVFYIIFKLLKVRDIDREEINGGYITIAAFLSITFMAISSQVIYSYICEWREEEERKIKDNVNFRVDASTMVSSHTQV